jgi:putative transposase
LQRRVVGSTGGRILPRMPRRQQQAPGSYDPLMNRGHHRVVVFPTDQDHASFLEMVDRYRQRFPLRIDPYGLMSNHFSLLVRGDSPEALSPCLSGRLRAYVHSFHRRYGLVGHLGQGRFQSPAVAVAAYFLRGARYLERNPVTAGVVQQPWDYRWSSCPAYALPARVEIRPASRPPCGLCNKPKSQQAVVPLLFPNHCYFC